MLRRNNGQSIVEYAILLGVVIAALLIMQVFIKRGYQGGLKESADKMGESFSASGTNIDQTRSLTGTQTIVEETATDTTMDAFKPSGATLKHTLASNALSYSSRSGGQNVTETNVTTEAAKQEKTRINEY